MCVGSSKSASIFDAVRFSQTEPLRDPPPMRAIGIVHIPALLNRCQDVDKVYGGAYSTLCGQVFEDLENEGYNVIVRKDRC